MNRRSGIINAPNLWRYQIVAVGDAAKIREALAKYGTVETYDPEGKLVKDASNK